MWSSKRPFLSIWRAGIALAMLLAAVVAVADDIVLMSARQGNITSLSRSEAEQLFLGRRTTVGAISPLLIDLPASELRDDFYLLLTGKNRHQIRAYWSRLVFTGRALPPREAASVEEARQLLLANRHAIAYLPARYADDPQLQVLLPLSD